MPQPVPAAGAQVGLGVGREAGDAARISRNARSAVVSSSTPGVLHTAMPCAAAARDVDVVVADRDVRDDAQPAGAAPAQHVGVDPVGEQRDDRVDLGARARRSSSGENGVSSGFGPTSSWPARAGRARRREDGG